MILLKTLIIDIFYWLNKYKIRISTKNGLRGADLWIMLKRI